MPTLYVTEPGSRIEREHGRLLVTLEDDVLTSVPLIHVSEVVLVGGVGATTPAMLALLDQGVGLTLISSTGRLRGRLQPAQARNLPLRRLQYRCTEDLKFCLEISRRIVIGKLRNTRTMAMRICRRAGQLDLEGEVPLGAHLADLEESLDRVSSAGSIAELRGLEGRGAKAYFAILRRALRADLPFAGRSRRPPRDPVNALLSLAYALLTDALFTAAEVSGMDPYAGFFHADKYGRPALALDLVEEFRPVVADSVMLKVVNNRMVKEGDFEDRGKGVRLKVPALRTYLRAFVGRLQTAVYHPLAGRPLTYQRIFEVQARQLRKAIEGGEPNYTPFLVK